MMAKIDSGKRVIINQDFYFHYVKFKVYDFQLQKSDRYIDLWEIRAEDVNVKIITYGKCYVL